MRCSSSSSCCRMAPNKAFFVLWAFVSVVLKCSHSSPLQKLTDFTHFPSFHEIEAYLHSVAANNGAFAKLSIEGETFEGRNIYLLQIGEDAVQERRAIFIDAGIHARERIAPTTALFIIHNLLELFNDVNDNDVRKKVTYYIMPVLNPDGYEYARTVDPMWRKNRNPPPEGSDCFGVDLNRNYNVTGFGVGASPDPCSDSYMGQKPDSEPEVRAASDFLLGHNNNIRASLSLHSYGQKWLTSWGFTTKRALDNDKLIDLGNRVAKTIKAVHGRVYEVESAGALYPAGGASDDFAKARAYIPYAVTVELPPSQYDGDGFLIKPDMIRGVGEELWEGLSVVAEAVLQEPLGPDASALLEEKLRRRADSNKNYHHLD